MVSVIHCVDEVCSCCCKISAVIGDRILYFDVIGGDAVSDDHEQSVVIYFVDIADFAGGYVLIIRKLWAHALNVSACAHSVPLVSGRNPSRTPLTAFREIPWVSPRSLLQDFAWGVGGRLRVLVCEFLDAAKDCIYLGLGSADKGVLVSKCF